LTMGKASIDIVLDNSLVQAGSWIKGYVLVNVFEGGVNAVALELTFRGHEYSEVEYSETEGSGDDRRSVQRTENSQRSIVDLRIPVNDMSFINKAGNRVDAGQYQIPFSVELPSFLPGSMNQSQSTNCCKIDYALKAILKGSGVLWNYHSERIVEMTAQPVDLTIPTEFNAPPVNERVNFCCCFNKGSITMGAKVEKTTLSPGSDLAISMSVRNYSSSKPKKVHARLRQEIKWGSGGRTFSINETIVSADFPGILSSILDYHELPRTVHSAQIYNEMQDMFREIEGGVHQGRLVVPINAVNSYSGHLITVKHRLELEVQTGCCITDPSIYVPINLQPAPLSAMSGTAPYSPPFVSAEIVQAPIVIAGTEETLPVIHVPNSKVYAVDGGSAVEPYSDDVYDVPSAEVPTIPLLYREMKGTVSHLDLVERRLKSPDWTSVWQQMNPTEYGKMVGLVQIGFDQPRVAELIAKEVLNFRCEYASAALRASMDFSRSKMVETLVPYCTDIKENHDIIQRDLTDWEALVTERTFAHALGGS